MNINIKATNIELTDAIREYVNKRVSSLEKLIKDGAIISVEVGRTTNHHNKGDIFKAEINIKNDGEVFYADVEREDLYSAIDEVKEEISRKLKRNKGRTTTLYRRGAKSVKKMLKGFTKRNPFTSKY